MRAPQDTSPLVGLLPLACSVILLACGPGGEPVAERETPAAPRRARGPKPPPRSAASDGLHRAVAKGQVDRLRRLLDAGADANRANADTETPLHVAAQAGQLEVARLLLDSGADANATTQHDDTALHLAAQARQLDSVRLLLERGADPQARNARQQTPLDLARERHQEEMVGLLEEAERRRELSP